MCGNVYQHGLGIAYTFKPVIDHRWNLDNGRIVFPDENLVYFAFRSRSGAAVIDYEFQHSFKAYYAVGLFLVIVPGLYRLRVNRSHVNLPESFKLRPIGAHNLHDTAALVANRFQLFDRNAFYHIISTRDESPAMIR